MNSRAVDILKQNKKLCEELYSQSYLTLDGRVESNEQISKIKVSTAHIILNPAGRISVDKFRLSKLIIYFLIMCSNDVVLKVLLGLKMKNTEVGSKNLRSLGLLLGQSGVK